MDETLSEIKSARADPRMAALLADYPDELFNDRLYRSTELIDRYSVGLAIGLVDRLGIRRLLSDWQSRQEISTTLGFTHRFGTALGWLLDRLLAAAILSGRERDNVREYRAESSWPVVSPPAVKALALEIDPKNALTLDLLDAAASAYPGVASGETTGEEALLGMGSIGLWLGYFSNDNPFYAVNNRVAAIAAVQRISDGRKLRILEVGAGAGSGAEALLDALAERDLLQSVALYRVSEPSAFLRRRGQRALAAAYPGVPLEFGGLDIDLPWHDQGASRGGFDLVFGVNVLHVAKDLVFSLRQAQQTLAPGGHLVAGECFRPFPRSAISIEFVFQILGSFVDVTTDPDVRPTPGFLTVEQWEAALARAGFHSVAFAPDHAKIREIYPGFLVGAVCAAAHA